MICLICSAESEILEYTKCSVCERAYCSKCLKHYNLPKQRGYVECVYCNIMGNNLNTIVSKIWSPFVLHRSIGKSNKIFLSINNELIKHESPKNEKLELRCLKLDHRGCSIIGEASWPDRYKLFFGSDCDKVLKDDNELKTNSSLKKRKDLNYTMTLELFKKLVVKSSNKNDLYFTIEYENVFDEHNSYGQDKDKIIYCLVFVSCLWENVDDYLKSDRVKTMEEAESFDFLKSLMGGDPENDDIQIEGLKLELKCNITLCPLEIPVRGNKCKHLNCFSLKSFLLLLNNSEKSGNVKNYCPICGCTIQFFYYDKLVERIIGQSEDKEEIYFKNLDDLHQMVSKSERVELKLQSEVLDLDLSDHEEAREAQLEEGELRRELRNLPERPETINGHSSNGNEISLGSLLGNEKALEDFISDLLIYIKMEDNQREIDVHIKKLSEIYQGN